MKINGRFCNFIHMKNQTLITIICLVVFNGIASTSFSQIFQVSKNEEGLAVTEEGKQVLFYQQKAKSLDGEYERANYIHPLYGLHGEVLSEDFPEDHYHHRGIFWAWHQILLEGKQVADAWDCNNVSWDVKRAKAKISDKAVAIHTKTLWRSRLDTTSAKTTTLFKEKTTITIYPREENYRVIDFQIRLFPRKEGLAIGGSTDTKGYGGFSPRIKLPNDIQFISNQGEVKAQRDGLKAGPWMDMLGTFDGQHPTGVAIITHPDYPSAQQLWILREERSMQNAAYPGNQAIPLTKNQALELRYRMVVHEQDQTEDLIHRLYEDFSKQ